MEEKEERIYITKSIGIPAMLEQTAEECTELAKAALKMARSIRNENKCYKSKEELNENLHEEIADIYLCLEELLHAGVTDMIKIDNYYKSKIRRAIKRFKEQEEADNE